jgi:uncharacterized SAM-binding protein YcdF (DUF218 family)
LESPARASQSKELSQYMEKMNISGSAEEEYLGTSAGHMPRSVSIFRNFGMHPVPAPTDFMTRRNFLATGYLPSPQYLRLSDLAVHECVGILWYRKGI